ncbi:3-hydroxyacyl-CoA dehydrogenase [Oxalobacteraceae bacterium CAVE-383]|nr:3-hydroxyacyl-CoA dehydrogenase [Oxalobacteraceae bacterium CAVE-383]
MNTIISAKAAASNGLLYVLDISGGRIFTVTPEGADKQILLTGCKNPDGIAVDLDAGRIYWTEMGVPHLDDGTISCADLNGQQRQTIIPGGITYTPKQICLDRKNRKLYWSDREGMRVMRADLDGRNVETLVETGHGDLDRGDQTRWCVGIAVDSASGHFYWSQKGPDNAGLGRIFRAGMKLPAGETAQARSDIELLYKGLPEPIDLELDLARRQIYWTDRGDPPNGNTVNRAPMDPPPGAGCLPEILVTHLMEGIGLALDLKSERMFITDLGGTVYCTRLDGSDAKTLLYVQGNLTGIAYASHAVPGE